MWNIREQEMNCLLKQRNIRIIGRHVFQFNEVPDQSYKRNKTWSEEKNVSYNFTVFQN